MKLFDGVGREYEVSRTWHHPCPAGIGESLPRRKNPAKTGAGKPRVATEFRLRRLLEHDDSRRAGLFRSDRRLERGAAAADHDHGNVFSFHVLTPRLDGGFTAGVAFGRRHLETVFLGRSALARPAHAAVMLLLVMLEADLVRVCAVAKAGATTRTATAGTVRKTRWQLDRLPRIIAERLVRLFFADGLHRQKAMLGDIEKVAVDIRGAGFGVGPAIGSLFGQLVGVIFLQPLDDFLAVLDFESRSDRGRWATVARGSAKSPD